MTPKKSSAQQLRIIGGKHKGRKLHFSGDANLRPTLGRTRETLFNWIRPHLADTRCLDAFAGSGGLGFEALSQGAGEVVLVEQNPRTVASLESSAQMLDAGNNCTIVKGDAIKYLKQVHTAFDIVFLDPPFSQPELLPAALELLVKHQLVTQFIYAEARTAAQLEAACTNQALTLAKQTRSGDTFAALLAM